MLYNRKIKTKSSFFLLFPSILLHFLSFLSSLSTLTPLGPTGCSSSHRRHCYSFFLYWWPSIMLATMSSTNSSNSRLLLLSSSIFLFFRLAHPCLKPRTSPLKPPVTTYRPKSDQSPPCETPQSPVSGQEHRQTALAESFSLFFGLPRPQPPSAATLIIS